MAKEKLIDEKEKMNPFLWFLFAIVIPVIIAIVLTITVFAVAGVDVVDWAKKTGNNIPVLSSIITTDEEARELQKEQNVQERIDAKDAEIEQLSQDKLNLEGTIESLEQKITKLERDLEVAKQAPEEIEPDKTIKQISSSFTKMKSEQAALILEQLDTDAAFIILSEMSNDDRGLVMENMDPEKAADITKRFINSNQ
jgi:flagellar protein FlbB